MKFKIHAQTNRLGSRVEEEVEIPDSELEGLEGKDRDKFIEEWMLDEFWSRELVQWGYEEKEDKKS
jgi:hypothetical protein